MRRVLAALIPTLLVIAPTLEPGPAGATPPGANGLITATDCVDAYDCTLHVFATDGSSELPFKGASYWAEDPTWSSAGPDQKIAFSGARYRILSDRSAPHSIFVAGGDGTGRRQVTTGPHDISPALAPGGRRLVFARLGGYGSRVLDILNLRTGALTPFTRSPRGVINNDPDWSPDGSQIAFAREIGNDWDLYLKDVDTGDLRQLTSGSGNDTDPSWSPDGTRIAFVSDRGGGGLYVLNVSTGQIALVDQEAVGSPTWSPDGTQIAVTWRDDGVENDAVAIKVIDVATGVTSAVILSQETGMGGIGDLLAPAWRPVT